MRNVLFVALALVACGGNKDKPKDAPVCIAPCDAPPGMHDDAPVQPTDSAPLTPCAPTAGSNVKARKIGSVSGGAILATSPPNDGRLFVIEQNGRLRIFEMESLRATPFLDISGIIVAGGEQGLLGLAFHPQYAFNGKFYVDYTAQNPVSGGDAFVDVVAEYHVSATDPNVADPTGTIILSIPDFASNHNGGMIEFGADGYLYIGTGDGGSGGDPNRNGQNPNALLGKMLRIDVDHPANGKPYGIPSDNPFASGTAGAPEVFMLGLRNPWRWSFDRGTGDMWIGDVGQGVTEEVNVLKAGQQRGANLGWSAFEGNACCSTQGDKCSQGQPQQACDMAGKVFPQDTRSHGSGWNAIIGGQVYRGACFPDLVGWYFYTDNGHGGMAKAQLQANGTLTVVNLTGTFPGSPSSLHADARGELYETDTSGGVWAIEAGP